MSRVRIFVSPLTSVVEIDGTRVTVASYHLAKTVNGVPKLLLTMEPTEVLVEGDVEVMRLDHAGQVI